jgi:nucleoside-diphosphate-sugar epimerase
MMDICIFGPNGYLGEKVVYNLHKKGFKLKLIARKYNDNFNELDNIEKVTIDINDKKTDISNLIQNCNILINCTGEISNLKKMSLTNTKLVNKILTSIESTHIKQKIHFIQISTFAIYKENYFFKDDYEDIDEEYSFYSNSNYGKTKLEADIEIIRRSNNGKYKYTILRPSAVISKDMKNQSLYKLINLIKNKRFFFIFNNKSVTSYVHIKDLVNAIHEVIVNNKAKNKIYNLGQNITFVELANFIMKELKIEYHIFTITSKIIIDIYSSLMIIFKPIIKLPNILNLTNKNKLNSQKIIKELNFKYSKQLTNSIKELIK